MRASEPDADGDQFQGGEGSVAGRDRGDRCWQQTTEPGEARGRPPSLPLRDAAPPSRTRRRGPRDPEDSLGGSSDPLIFSPETPRRLREPGEYDLGTPPARWEVEEDLGIPTARWKDRQAPRYFPRDAAPLSGTGGEDLGTPPARWEEEEDRQVISLLSGFRDNNDVEDYRG